MPEGLKQIAERLGNISGILNELSKTMYLHIAKIEVKPQEESWVGKWVENLGDPNLTTPSERAGKVLEERFNALKKEIELYVYCLDEWKKFMLKKDCRIINPPSDLLDC